MYTFNLLNKEQSKTRNNLLMVIKQGLEPLPLTKEVTIASLWLFGFVTGGVWCGVASELLYGVGLGQLANNLP